MATLILTTETIPVIETVEEIENAIQNILHDEFILLTSKVIGKVYINKNYIVTYF